MRSLLLLIFVFSLIANVFGKGTSSEEGGNNEPSSSEVEFTTTEHLEEDLPSLENKARNFAEEVQGQTKRACNKAVIAEWAFASNITDENQKNSLIASLEYAQYKKDMWKRTVSFPWEKFEDKGLKRMFKFMSVLGTDALPEDKLEKFTTAVNDMTAMYSKAKVCDFTDKQKCTLSLEPELKEILAKSRNYEELEHVWLSWRDASGKRMPTIYSQYVDLLNEAAKMNGFKDASKLWLMSYESETFEEDVYRLWEQVKPLYEQLHAYVRRQLRKEYGADKISKDGAIPAHVVGDMWAQRWGNILNFSTPYPEKASVDVTPAMIKQNYTALKMFQASEEFFKSVNLTGMPREFWAESIIEKPTDRDIVCHASAWDFCNGIDFRIKQCTQVTMSDFIVVHHEMGHIEYFIQYKDQMITYREGANPGFHEAVGDLLALSVSTPKHLKEVGLLEAYDDDKAANINYLYSQALEKIPFIPSALVIEQWRWDIFQGKTSPKEYNCNWWKLRSKLQGLRPPKTRKSSDFDAGAKYHVPANTPYIRYFVSYIVQYQFHKSLCIAAGEYDPEHADANPLHKCDIYGKPAAGNKLSAMLKLGSSRPWTEALEQVTGSNRMDAAPLLEYFKPLYDWLKEDNEKHNEFVGWKESDEPMCISDV